jgi:hypothetical protein
MPKMTPKPSLKLSANGMPPGPVWPYKVRFRPPARPPARPPGLGALPSYTAMLERYAASQWPQFLLCSH